MTEYVEISSARRNRILYPNPSTFAVQFLGSSSSQDIVALSTIIHPPPNLNKNTLYDTFVYGGLSTTGDVYHIDCIPLVVHDGITYSSYDINASNQAYIGKTLELVHDVSLGVQHEFRIIQGFELKNNGFSFTTTVGTLFSQTSFTINTIIELPHILVGWKGTFQTTTNASLAGKSFLVSDFRAFDQTVFISTPMSPAITAGDTIIFTIDVIRITIDQPFSQVLDALTTGHLLLANNTQFRIRGEQPALQTNVINSTAQSVQAPFSEPMNERWIWVSSPILLYAGTPLAFGTNSVQLSGTTIVDDLFGATILVTSGTYSGYEYTIRSWNPISELATITPTWDGTGGTPTPGDTIEIQWGTPSLYTQVSSYQSNTNTAYVSPHFEWTPYNETYPTSLALAPQTNIEVLPISYQNYVPIRFTTSLVSQQQSVCHEIELLQLTIPNLPVYGVYGGYLMQYPYIYVQFRSSSSSPYEIQSNDPASTYMLFRAMIRTSSLQIQNKELKNAPFLTLCGNGMKQIVKFSPNDTFTFGVYLPDGSLLNLGQDYFTPAVPNLQCQITALFSIRRLV